MKRLINKAITGNGGGVICGLIAAFFIFVMGFSVLFSVSVMLRDPPSDGLWPVVEAPNLDSDHLQKGVVFQADENDTDLVDDLLPNGFDETTCLSRYQSPRYRRGRAPRQASPSLISRLRSYEARHKRCGPHTDSYNKTVQHLIFKTRGSSINECNYIVWISYSGLGNRILSLSSAFLYALLTNRVLLVDRKIDGQDLFCEPFPETSWLLPADFPLTNSLSSFKQSSQQSYGNMLKSNATSLPPPRPYIYLHLDHGSDDQDKLFFCDQEQPYLLKVPWLVIRSNHYFVPSLFMMPAFEQELHGLFPDKEAVFHLLARYLFHPTNSVWGLITRYYEAYLSNVDATVGIQIRVFKVSPPLFFKYILDQILSCTMRENILPKISKQKQGNVGPIVKQKNKTVAVMFTSLTSGYYEQVRDFYWENPSTTGEVIAVFQPSNEGYQQSEKPDHNRKAWAEMYLLSMTDKLVTSSRSTFGYVAQGLGGLKPWILYKNKRPKNQKAPDPPCRRAMSMEPCFHAPPNYDCKERRWVDPGAVVPHVRHCEDEPRGIKIVEPMLENRTGPIG